MRECRLKMLHILMIVIFLASIQNGQHAWELESCGASRISDSSNLRSTHTQARAYLHGDNGSRIVNGFEANHGDFPWQVAIFTGRRFSRPKCGGSIIAHDFVLTAGHCHPGHGDITVASGILTLERKSSNTQYVAARLLARHPDYVDSTLANDIMLIQLERNLRFDEYTKPVCQPSKPEFNDGQESYVSGWGSTLAGSGGATMKKSYPKEMMFTSVQLMTVKDCIHKYSQIKLTWKIEEGMHICGTDKEADACLGDSGGALVVGEWRAGTYNYKQVGIVSWGVGCAIYPGVYINVYDYNEWIDATLTSIREGRFRLSGSPLHRPSAFHPWVIPVGVFISSFI